MHICKPTTFVARCIYILMLYCCTPRQGYGQNLVANPSFENIVACPWIADQLPIAPGPATSLLNWFKPNCGTVDYFNPCATSSLFSTPQNIRGYQQPHDGNAYIGCVIYSSLQNICREYAQSLLLSTLVADRPYYVSFWVSLADGTDGISATDQIGAYLGPGYIISNGTAHIDYVTPQVTLPNGNLVTDTANWTKISGVFVATGNESAIMLGGFVPFANQNMAVQQNGPNSIFSYYYIDDVCVTPVKTHSRDTVFCHASQGSLYGRPGMAEYEWNTGATNGEIEIRHAGTYWVKSIGSCEAWIDTIVVKGLYDSLKVDLGPDTVLCFGKRLQLDASSPAFQTYLWNTGDTSATISAGEGQYIVTASGVCGTFTDTINIIVKAELQAPAPLDTLVCTGDQGPFQWPYREGEVMWRTDPGGEGSLIPPLINTSVAGRFAYYITTVEGSCESVTAQAILNILNTPEAHLPSDTDLCIGKVLQLGQAQEGVRYEWNTGDTTCCISVRLSGQYKVKATNDCGLAEAECTAHFSDCDNCIWLPNAFSPNNDGKNDVLKIRALCPVNSISFRIYNRYGQQVFSANDLDSGWDGTQNGRACDAATYYYYLEADISGMPKFMKKGDITLLR